MNPLNFDKIPRNTLTHYAYKIYQNATRAQATVAGHAPRPQIQRKTIKDQRPLTATEKITLGPIIDAPKPRNKFRKDISKDALATYFDNYALQSRQTMKQENLAEMVAELEWADTEKNAAKTTKEEIREFVESVRAQEQSRQPETSIRDDDDEYRGLDLIKEYARAIAYSSWYKIATYAHILDIRQEQMNAETRIDINQHIADHLVQKYNKADTSAAMRAYEKQKRHSTKLARMLHELQITK